MTAEFEEPIDATDFEFPGAARVDVEGSRLELVATGDYDLLLDRLAGYPVVAETFLSMVPDVVLVPPCTFLGVVVGAVIIDEGIDLFWLAVLHAASVPYLLARVAFGLFLSVVVASERRAQILAFAGVVVTYLLEALTRDTDYDWVGALTFPRYLDPNAILIDDEVDPMAAAVLVATSMVFLLAAAAVLVAASMVFLLAAAAVFERVDVTT